MPKIMPLIWAGRAVAVTLVALAFTDTIPSGSFLFWLLFGPGRRPCPPWRRLAKAPVIYIFSLPCYNSKK